MRFHHWSIYYGLLTQQVVLLPGHLTNLMTNDKSCDGQNFTHLANLQFSPNRSFSVISHPIWESTISQSFDLEFVSEIEGNNKKSWGKNSLASRLPVKAIQGQVGLKVCCQHRLQLKSGFAPFFALPVPLVSFLLPVHLFLFPSSTLPLQTSWK